ncbi:MAG: hypothetical protein IH585_01030 [Anaerolineaceae bacterium]|nr:hypothetical protein [Anaerolineaceae bacterium]
MIFLFLKLGLMAAVLMQLGRSSLTDPLTIIIGLISAILLIRYRVNSTWLILGGGIIGLVSALV